MSVEQLQRDVNNLDKDIAVLEKKQVDCDKKIAEFQSKISSTKRSITKNTSASLLTSKAKQISDWEKDAAKKATERADLGKKISDKRQKRSDTYIKLQKAAQEQNKLQEKRYKQMQSAYEERITELSKQIIATPIAVEDEGTEIESEQYDVFLSHAWEDKESFVDEFIQELSKLDIKAWYDKERIAWGDSMRAQIDDGLKKSRFGIVVISPNYIAEGKYWTKQELDGLFQLESINGKTILPIWHEITKKEVMAYSPLIAGKLAMTTATMTAKEIAEELKMIIDRIKTEGKTDANT